MDDISNTTLATAVITFFAITLLLWDIKHSFKEEKERERFYEEERAALSDVSEVSLTPIQFKRYLTTVLAHVACEKLTKVILTDEKEVSQGVLLSYGEYKSLLAFKHLYEHNAEEKIKERLLWQEHAIKASLDEEYIKELRELG